MVNGNIPANERETDMATKMSTAAYARASEYPTHLWVVVINEYPLIEGTVDPDRSQNPVTVDVLAFPARGTADTAAVRRFIVDNTYVDCGRKTYRTCDARMAEVRR